MSLQTRLSALITAIGADVKSINSKATRFGTAAQMAALDPTTVPLGTEFVVTDDVTWGKVRYAALGSPQVWTQVGNLNSLTGREIAVNEVVGNYDCASATVAVNVGSPLAFNAPGGDYRVIVTIPLLGTSVANVRALALLYDERGAPSGYLGSAMAASISATLGNGTGGQITTGKITGVAAGTAKSYQLVSLRTAENTGSNRVGSATVSSVVQPIVMRAVTA